MGLGSYKTENGYWPIFSTEFGKIVCFADFGNRNIVGHGNFVFSRTEYGKVPILRTPILLKQ